MTSKTRACHRRSARHRPRNGQQQAIKFASIGIRVNAVAPGPVGTAVAIAMHTPEIRAKAEKTADAD